MNVLGSNSKCCQSAPRVSSEAWGPGFHGQLGHSLGPGVRGHTAAKNGVPDQAAGGQRKRIEDEVTTECDTSTLLRREEGEVAIR